MMDYSKKNPNASYYEMLLRAALHYQSMAAEIYSEAMGHVDDFRILALLCLIAENYQSSKKEMVPNELVDEAQGSDLRPWLDGINWHLPGGAQECRLYWQDAIVGLKRAKAQKMIDTATMAAHWALKDGNQERYKELLADMQELRRKTKKIIY